VKNILFIDSLVKKFGMIRFTRKIAKRHQNYSCERSQIKKKKCSRVKSINM